MVTRRAGEDKQYYDHTVAGPPDQGVSRTVGGHVSPVRGQSPERIQVRAQPSPRRSPQRAQGVDQRREGHQQQRYEDLNKNLDNRAEDKEEEVVEEEVITEAVAEEEVKHKIEEAEEIRTIDKNL